MQRGLLHCTRCPRDAGISFNASYNQFTRIIYREEKKHRPSQKSSQNPQTRGCPAHVPLPRQWSRFLERPRPDPLLISPRTPSCQPQSSPVVQSRRFQRPGGCESLIIPSWPSSQVQWSRAPNLSLGPGPSTQALNCAQSKWQVCCLKHFLHVTCVHFLVMCFECD